MKVAIYGRVSTDYQELDRQLNEGKSLATNRGWHIVGVYSEVISGAKTKRKERDKVLALIKRGEIDAVIVTELSRWGRNLEDLIQTIELMGSRKVKLITTKGFEFDITTLMGKLFFQLMAVLAEFERGLTGERVQSGMREAARRGKRISRPRGVKNKRISDKTRQILEFYKQDMPILQISKLLDVSRPTIIGILREEGLYKLTPIPPQLKRITAATEEGRYPNEHGENY